MTKRFITAAFSLCLLLSPAGASAQWFLFPGSRPQSDTLTVISKEAKDEGGAARRPGNSGSGNTSHSGTGLQDDSGSGSLSFGAAVPDSSPVRNEEADTTGLPYRWGQHRNDFENALKVSLILPFRTSGTPNSNFLDFYSGALLAADRLASAGSRISLRVFDSSEGLPGAGVLQESDLIIGPVSCDDILPALALAGGKFIVSPLDPKAAEFTSRHNLIQAPSGWEAQVDGMVQWLAADLMEGESVILLQSDSEAGGEITGRMALRLADAGIPYEISSAPFPEEGGRAAGTIFVIASENDEFCCNCIREIAIANLQGGDYSVYSTSRLRALQDLETESLHAARAHITASYYADQANPLVQAFARDYKRLFKAEPGQWAYQGYDLMYYFGRRMTEDPQDWPVFLPDHPANGLQTDFRFDGSGRNNTAVRKLRYDPANTITIIR